MAIARFDALLRPSERAMPFVLATAGTLALLGILVLAPILGTMNERAAAPTTAASATPAVVTSAAPAPTGTVTPSPTASPLPPGTFENPTLGYRITFPEGYRRSRATIVTGHQEALGGDFYTLQTEREEREQCLRDGGDVGFPRTPERASDVGISVSRNVRGISAAEWASSSPYSQHQKVQPLTIAGYEAVRLVSEKTGETHLFVIRANERMYVIGPDFWSEPSQLPKGWLDDIVKTFVAIAPAPFPSPTPSTPPRTAARELAEALAKAFSARDADAVARLMPSCWLNVTTYIDGQGTGGVLYRSVAQFRQGLRERFAAGDLTVTVDPTPQPDPSEADLFVVRSDWKEPDRTTRIDLFLAERAGRWHWFIALHHYQRAQLTGSGCIPYRSPWVSPTGSC